MGKTVSGRCLKIRLFSAISLIALLGAVSGASEIYPFFRDVRAQGMGGAAIAVVDDNTSLFLNPAGLGKIRGASFTVADPIIETNYDTQAGLGTNNNYTAFLDQSSFMNVAKASPDKHMHAMTEIFPTFTTTNFGFGVFGRYDVDSQFTSATNTYHLDYFNDYGAVIGYCFRLLSGRLKIGVSGKFLNRVYVNQDIAGGTTSLSLGNISQEGDGVGWDGGMTLTAPWTYLPTLSVVAHDIGNTYFNLGNGYFYKPGTVPPPINQEIDAAIAIFPIFSNTTRSSFTVEYRDVQNPESQDIYRRIHAGAELDFGDTFFVRGGMNQRYYTAGLELDVGHNQFQIATYGEEIGTPTSYQEDRRYMFQYSLRF